MPIIPLNDFGLEYKFLASFIKGEPDECWNYIGKVNKKGYGVIGRKMICYSAHVLAYAYYHKVSNIELCVLHKCDNTRCLNPNHLFLGTNGDNNADRHNKGRDAVGENHGAHILTEEEVLEIREEYKTSCFATHRSLAKKYGVTKNTITRILAKQTWKHLLPA